MLPDEGILAVDVRRHVVRLCDGKALLERAVRVRDRPMRAHEIAEGEMAHRLVAAGLEGMYLVRAHAAAIVTAEVSAADDAEFAHRVVVQCLERRRAAVQPR